MLVLSATEVVSLLDLDALADALQAAMVDLSAGQASVPPRVAALVPQAGQGMITCVPCRARQLLLARPALRPGRGGTGRRCRG